MVWIENTPCTESLNALVFLTCVILLRNDNPINCWDAVHIFMFVYTNGLI